jgi:phytoene dehydrogenase-like protein
MSGHDAIVVGGGHNGLVAATLLARAGKSVLMLERRDQIGGAAVSGRPFDGVDARLSRYSYLVSLFPAELARELGLAIELRTRSISSYTPLGAGGLLVSSDGRQTSASMARATGDPSAFEHWQGFYAMLADVARRVSPSLTEPLRTPEQLRELVADDAAWTGLFEQPLSELLERTFESDPIRGVVLTDATIGTFAPAADPQLRQNRCFLYHVIGDGTGLWKVPVGGMGALTAQLARAAHAAGTEIRTATEVDSVKTDGREAEVVCADGSRHRGRHVLANVAPAVLSEMLGEQAAEAAPQGSQLKINMLLKRLPRLRDPDVTPEQAFAGTFHVNEGYEQLQIAYDQACAGQIPTLPPCELYCHSLTDPTILSDDLRAAGVQTLTLFGLHMPARLFKADHDAAKRAALEATLSSMNRVLAEPIEDCLALDGDGAPCLEALTPLEVQAQLGMPGGHIFHRDLSWPFAESDAEIGTWGVETAHANVWLCGAGARRGGGVSGIPGHNAAQAVLAASG